MIRPKFLQKPLVGQTSGSVIKLSVVAFTILLSGFLMMSCEKQKNVVEDSEKTLALKNVTIEYDSMSYGIGLPEGALSGIPFDSLLALDSAKYADPANYSIDFTANTTADNTSEDAEDAKFDGMILDIIMDTITSGPIRTTADGFDIAKNTTKPVTATGSINLETHKRTGLYIFRQTVDGNDLATTFDPTLKYKIGIQEGDIPLPSIQQDIPTRASPETIAFLEAVLASGILEQ